ncbi:MAG: hypothetical protein ABSA84_08260 [Gammaproteobacteria bacterium]
MYHIKDNFKLGDLVYGLQCEREKITKTFNILYPDHFNMWTIDQVNKKIVLPTIEKMELTLKAVEELGCLSGFGLNFFNYLVAQQDTQQFINVMQKTKDSDGEDNYLTRYNCQQAVKYMLQNEEDIHIHFILDGIDVSKALQEVDQSRSSFTSSEIREIARNLENPEIANKIFFYRNNQQVDFVTIKEEFRAVMESLGVTPLKLQKSPIKEIAAKEKVRSRNKKDKPPVSSRRALSFALTSSSGMGGLFNPAGLFADLSVKEKAAYPLCDKLNSWFLDQQNLSASLSELYSIFSEINIELIKEHIEKYIVRREEIRDSLMRTMKQFAEREMLITYNKMLVAAGGSSQEVSLQQLKATCLKSYETAERFNAYITDQLTTNKNDYLSLMRNLFELGEISNSSSSSTSDLAERINKLFMDIKELCKVVFSVPDPFSSLSFLPKTPPLQYTPNPSLPSVCTQLGVKADQ